MSLSSVRQACERSLKKLGVESIDLYYIHRVVPKVPIELTIRAMKELVLKRKVCSQLQRPICNQTSLPQVKWYLGLSECTVATLRRAHAVHPITAVQVEYSLFTLDVEDPSVGLIAAFCELGVALVAYSPLGRGLLTGKIRSRNDLGDEGKDMRWGAARFSEENFH